MEDGGTDGRSRNNHLFDTIWLYTGDVDMFEGQDQETVAGSGYHCLMPRGVGRFPFFVTKSLTHTANVFCFL
jgi:hypothetical protein